MAIKRAKWPLGRAVTLEHVSSVLSGNPLGDPHVRRVPVYLPPGHDADPDRRYPVLFALAGFSTGDAYELLVVGVAVVAVWLGFAIFDRKM